MRKQAVELDARYPSGDRDLYSGARRAWPRPYGKAADRFQLDSQILGTLPILNAFLLRLGIDELLARALKGTLLSFPTT